MHRKQRESARERSSALLQKDGHSATLTEPSIKQLYGMPR